MKLLMLFYFIEEMSFCTKNIQYILQGDAGDVESIYPNLLSLWPNSNSI